MSEERVKNIMKKTKVKKIPKRKQLKEIEKHLPKSYRPISGWGYFWRSVFYAIPVIGWLFVLINALGAKNRNGRNFARSYFCGLLMAIIVAAIVVAIYFAAGAALGQPLQLLPEVKKSIWDAFYKLTSLIPL